MADSERNWAGMGDPNPDKERLTLRLKPEVKERLKARASQLGLSPSAYVTALLLKEEGR